MELLQPPQVKLGVGLEEGSSFAVWTRPPKTTWALVTRAQRC